MIICSILHLIEFASISVKNTTEYVFLLRFCKCSPIFQQLRGLPFQLQSSKMMMIVKNDDDDKADDSELGRECLDIKLSFVRTKEK